MKKTILALLCAISAGVYANDLQLANLNSDEAPQIFYNILEKNQAGLSPITGDQISRNQSNQQLCWWSNKIANVQPNSTVQVTRHIQTPSNGKMQIPNDGNVVYQTNADASNHILRNFALVSDKQTVSECWVFNPTDPVGDYTFTVIINDTQYTPFTVKVVD